MNVYVLAIASLFLCCECIRVRIPIGIILEPDSTAALTVMKYGLRLQDRRSDWPRQYEVELVKESVASDSLTELDKAVCRLMKRGVYAVIAPTTARSYPLLASHSSTYEFPLISPALPEIPRDFLSKFTIGIQPSTTRAIIDLLRNFEWEHIVYLYDEKQGPERLQQIFHLGFGAFRSKILGIQRASDAEQVNQYFRKLEQSQKHRALHVILDVDPLLAKDIIVRHVHDIFVGKNYHFLITTPVLKEFWSSHVLEFGAMNVTGFSALTDSAEDSFREQWMKLSPGTWPGAGAPLNVTSYFYHDAVYLLGEALRNTLSGRRYRPPKDEDLFSDHDRERNCILSSQPLPMGQNLTFYLKKGLLKDALTGPMTFDAHGNREKYEISIIEISGATQRLAGTWSDSHGLHIHSNSDTGNPVALPQKEAKKKRYLITSILNPPFLMMRNEGEINATKTSDAFQGYSKDLIDLLANELDFEYDIKLVSDGSYGRYRQSEGRWTGMVGEIIRGEADIAVADLNITPGRLRVVDFMDTYMTASLSILMKNAQFVSSKSSLFFTRAFSAEVWACILVSALFVLVLFHVASKYTGAPDTIEAASGVWGKKFSPIESLWFVFGSGLFQGTGIYPRSMSCRILAAAWWCFLLMVMALFLSSVTTQLSENNDDKSSRLNSLKSLTLESVVMEAVKNKWPGIGVVRNGTTHRYIQESSLPFLKEYEAYLKEHPEFFVRSVSEGIERVQKSSGDYALFMESSTGEFISSQRSCDTISIRDFTDVFYFGVVVPLGSPLRAALNEALERLKERGELSHLQQIWFHDRSKCAMKMTAERNNLAGGLHSFSGLLLLLLVCLAIVAIFGAIQYIWRARMKSRGRKNISFEEVTMPHALPHPPPELLREPSSEEDNGPIDGWAERKLVPTSFSYAARSQEEDK